MLKRGEISQATKGVKYVGASFSSSKTQFKEMAKRRRSRIALQLTTIKISQHGVVIILLDFRDQMGHGIAKFIRVHNQDLDCI